ncbi:hypothetical protein TNCV_1988501 [Trichonephila clavipes]|nr:hypothetical protein TNCV_1988501 [Trichonephila clavipes]
MLKTKYRLTRKNFSSGNEQVWKTHQTLNEMFEKVPVLLDCPTVSSEEFIAVDDDVCKSPITADKDTLEFVLKVEWMQILRNKIK